MITSRRFLIVAAELKGAGVVEHSAWLDDADGVSNFFDMMDCHEMGCITLHYITDAGKILPVKYGEKEKCSREENDVIYASTALLVYDGGRDVLVGAIYHTEH
jgi:hypothetical protein